MTAPRTEPPQDLIGSHLRLEADALHIFAAYRDEGLPLRWALASLASSASLEATIPQYLLLRRAPPASFEAFVALWNGLVDFAATATAPAPRPVAGVRTPLPSRLRSTESTTLILGKSLLHTFTPGELDVDLLRELAAVDMNDGAATVQLRRSVSDEDRLRRRRASGLRRDSSDSTLTFRKRRLSKDLPSPVAPAAEAAVPRGEAEAPAVAATAATLHYAGEMLDAADGPETQWPFSREVVGTFSCQGLAPAKINQDCGGYAHPFRRPGQALFCVLDGHGARGDEAARAALDAIVSSLAAVDADAELSDEAFCASFEDAEEAIGPPGPGGESGACAVVALLRANDIIVAGAGDCRCVLGRSKGPPPAPGEGMAAAQYDTLELSTVHTLASSSERLRIEAAGGRVSSPRSPSRDGYYEPARVYADLGRRQDGPGLAMTRSVGDCDATRVGVIPTPDVAHHAVTPDDAFLILATDGVWEFVDPDEAVAIVGGIKDKGWSAEAATKHLIARAAVEWMNEEGDYRDDITCIVVYLAEVVALL